MDTVDERNTSATRGLADAWDASKAPHQAWLTRPLCRQYAFAAFAPVNSTSPQHDSGRPHCWYWALGMLMDGQVEILGAWQGVPSSIVQLIAADLEARGVERLGTVRSKGSLVPPKRNDADSTTCEKEQAPSLIKAVASSASGPASVRETSHAMAVRAVVGRVQNRLDRTLRRRGPLSDPYEAARLIALALQKAETNLQYTLVRSRTGQNADIRGERQARTVSA